MRLIKSLLAAAVLSISPITTPSAYAAQQLDNGVWADFYYYDNGRTARLGVFFHAADNNGKLAICGTYYMWGGASFHRRMLRELRRYRVYYQGRALTSGVTFMNRARTEAQIPESFGCISTDLPFTPNANDQLSGNIPGSG